MAESLNSTIHRLLDKGYEREVQTTLRAIHGATNSGKTKDALDNLKDEARLLRRQREKLSPDNQVLRETLFVFGDAMRDSANEIRNASGDLVGRAADAAAELARKDAENGLPKGLRAEVRKNWASPNPDALKKAIDISSSPEWYAKVSKYGDDVSTIIMNQAIRGFVQGWNPVRVASLIRKTAENLPKSRADALMRTLYLHSYRHADTQVKNENRHLLKEVVRVENIDRRICLSCIGLHGLVVWRSEDGGPVPSFEDHYNGRGRLVSVVKGDNKTFQRGDAVWATLPAERQRELLKVNGIPGAYEELRSGKIKPSDFISYYEDSVFGRMSVQSSLKAARDRAANRTVVPLQSAPRPIIGDTIFTTFEETNKQERAMYLPNFKVNHSEAQSIENWTHQHDRHTVELQRYGISSRADFDGLSAADKKYVRKMFIEEWRHKDVNISLNNALVSIEELTALSNRANAARDRGELPPLPIVYRGEGRKEHKWKQFKRGSPTVGEVISFDSFHSTSLDPVAAYNFSKMAKGSTKKTRWVMAIKPKRGVYIDGYSHYGGEYELLKQKGDRLRYIGKKTVTINHNPTIPYVSNQEVYMFEEV